MKAENAMRVSGDLLATSAASIGAALAPVFPDAKVEVSTEVTIEGDDMSIAIYPDRDAFEGGSDFLVAGNLWLDHDDARALLHGIMASLARASIAHSLEVSRGGSPDATAGFSNERYALLVEARGRARR